MHAHPPIVPQKDWESAVAAIRVKEKAAMKARDALAAERRRLPMMKVENDYLLQGPNGPAHLTDVFEGRQQLLLYHFMLGSNQTVGCDGCSMVLDQITHLAHLHARGVTFACVSRAPLAIIEAYRKRMGWTVPWYSSFGTDLSLDMGTGPKEPKVGAYQDGENFAMSALLRDGDAVYRTYFTTARGVETLGTIWSLLDITPFGRRETWEDSPEGWPQTKPYEWWRRHDEYGKEAK
ncbi:MAG TPA: DUF899 domain-containing protein [Candidatus Binatia bacterium]|nr:DUF899 domain-containing protein [Candidatus Binatia bacterium]